MSDLIHDYPLNIVRSYKHSSKEVSLEGHELSKAKMLQLLELFRKAEFNVLYKERPSGPSYVLDLTSDQRNLRLCTFDTEELLDGWYALKTITYNPRAGEDGYYHWRIVLYYVGTVTGYQEWYEWTDIAIAVNDWGL